jgi:hypothetical protein
VLLSFDQVPMARRVRALHYLHIPPATPLLPRKGAATADATDATDAGSSISGGSALLRRQRVADLRAGDTFLLDLDWAQSQVKHGFVCGPMHHQL